MVAVEESRRDRKKRLTRQRIVDTAIRLFEEQGYEKTTVAQIAAAADVDPKTFFNYFGTKDEVLFNDVRQDLDVLYGAIAERRAEEGPGEALARAVRTYAAHRRPRVPSRGAVELSAAARLALSTPALQVRGLHVLLELQQRMAEELCAAFPELDPVTAAAMTGALLGAIQHAGYASVHKGRSQAELWQATERAVDVALHGLLAAGGTRPRKGRAR
ncbi:TetR/AcrR family transcriptional regulator [Actinocatenispora rupis]|uniref:TetR family transcriptional regulator n=1 Tax=Actinocatenispora rupis TaxID=519421 RepID=A0A8J3NAW2_9ACTN|nr:TetR family transcriptional regulator [Actinocatenispora rupis]